MAGLWQGGTATIARRLPRQICPLLWESRQGDEYYFHRRAWRPVNTVECLPLVWSRAERLVLVPAGVVSRHCVGKCGFTPLRGQAISLVWLRWCSIALSALSRLMQSTHLHIRSVVRAATRMVPDVCRLDLVGRDPWVLDVCMCMLADTVLNEIVTRMDRFGWNLDLPVVVSSRPMGLSRTWCSKQAAFQQQQQCK